MATSGMNQQNLSFYSSTNSDTTALLPMQVSPTAPSISGLNSATGMVFPDKTLRERLQHFQSDLYDLRDESHLMRLLQALMGDSGVGQLRKRYLISQFLTSLSTTHFYDLDRFWGGIFGISRVVNEALPSNPETSNFTLNETDDLLRADASFKNRIFRLARSINLGGTYGGLKGAAEALTEVECDLYETWAMIDTYGIGAANPWSAIEAIGTYQQIEDSQAGANNPTWQQLTGAIQIGRTATNTRNEVTIVPRKDYGRISLEVSADEAARQKAEDEIGIIRVLNTIKPANVLLTVSADGVALHEDAAMAALKADSNYWTVVTTVAPRPNIYGVDPYPVSVQQALDGILSGDLHEMPKPMWSVTQGAQWTHNHDIATVSAYSYSAAGTDDPGSGVTQSGDSDTIAYQDGTAETFTPDRGVLDPRLALAARYAKAGILVAAPFSAERQEAIPRA